MAEAKENIKQAPYKRKFPGKVAALPDEAPLWPAATSEMKIDVAVNEDCKVWVIHNKPFPDYLEWVEFEPATGMMNFITAKGKIQDLGTAIYQPMAEYVAQAKEVCVMMVRNNEVRDMALVPLIIQDYGLVVKRRRS